MGGGSSKSTSNTTTNTTTINKTIVDSYNTSFNRADNTTVNIGDLRNTIPGFAAAAAGPKIFLYVAGAGLALVALLKIRK